MGNEEFDPNRMNRLGAPRISVAFCSVGGGRVVAGRRHRRRRRLRGRLEPFESEREEQTETDAERD